MKKLYISSLILLSWFANGQEISEHLYSPLATNNGIYAELQDHEDKVIVHNRTNDEFAAAAEKNNVAHRTLTDLPNTSSGYYIVQAVLSKTKNIKKTVKKLNNKGFEAGAITDSENELNYIYLERFEDWREAISQVKSKFDGAVEEEIWILNIQNSANNQALEGDENEAEETLSNQSTIKTTATNKSKLVQKADLFFNKMWYAEAAELYEEALKKDKDNYTSGIIQKAADSYYFNTNMEKAYEWYNILYEEQGKEMAIENTFRYSHALKGVGKYNRAKRLMRLYNKKLIGEDDLYKDIDQTQNEVVLDNILAATATEEIKNLSINSKYSEFAPMFLDSTQLVYSSAKDSSFFSTRTYKWNDQPFLDLYVAQINEEDQELKQAIKFSKEINTKYHEASVAFTPDNSTMFFTRNNYGKKLKRDKNGVNHLKIYVSKKVDGKWQEATELPFNSDDYSTGHPALSSDGKKLYFISDMPGSIGASDIFVTDILEAGQFSDPKNLGPTVNTEQREMFPFIKSDKLYFASDGHVGLGGLDIYVADLDENKGILGVENLGIPINSNKDDFSYITNGDNGKGYFASNREGGKGDDDIYSFKQIELEEIAKVNNAVSGIVTDLVTGNILPGALVELLDENGIKLKEVGASDKGEFIFEDLDSNTKYTLKTTNKTYFESRIDISSKENEQITQDVALRRLEQMITIDQGIKKLKTEIIYFGFDQYHIRDQAAVELKKLVEVMNEYPNMVIKIESHTDSRGPAEYNKYLSDRRAKSTRDYIVSQGISSNRIQSANGYGEEMLLNNCNGQEPCSEEQHFLNRRSEFIIVEM